MGGLQNRSDLVATDGTTPVVGAQDYGLERLLTEALWSESGVAVHGTVVMPWFGEINFNAGSQQALKKITEVVSA